MESIPPVISIVSNTFLQLIEQIDTQVTPIIVEKQGEHVSSGRSNNNNTNTNGQMNSNGNAQRHYSNRSNPSSSTGNHYNGPKRSPGKKRNNHNRRDQSASASSANWEDIRVPFKSTVIEKASDEGVQKWIQDIRACINKLSTKNYENQRDKILEYLDKCNQSTSDDDSTKSENLKTIANFIFSVASTNKFYVDLYANLFVELVEKYDVFRELLYSYLNIYVNSIKDMHYVDANENYEQYCQYNKQNDMRKATAIFIVRLVEKKVVSMLRLLNIMNSFQELSSQMVDLEGRENEVHEIAEILYLFIQEGKSTLEECKGEWIWKFVIEPHIQTMSQCKRGDKKSLASRTIFKYMDMGEPNGET
jgi:hypothetical protein